MLSKEVAVEEAIVLKAREIIKDIIKVHAIKKAGLVTGPLFLLQNISMLNHFKTFQEFSGKVAFAKIFILH